MRKKNLKTDRHTNLKMDDSVFKLRRQVIDIIHDAKTMVALPRIDVRITTCTDKKVLGTAHMSNCTIWIPATSFGRKDLRQVVFHEILHAVFGVEHNEWCELMCSIVKPISKEKTNRLFIKHVIANSGVKGRLK